MVLYELRYDTEISMAFLMDCYRNYAGRLTDEELTVLETDMAYFHIGGWYCYDEEGLDLLVSAAARNCRFPQTYYALGWALFHEQEYKDAAIQFDKAYSICLDKRLLYNEAVSLYYNRQIDKSMALLEKIIPIKYYKKVDYRIGVFYATLLAMREEHEKAREFLDNFLEYYHSETDAVEDMDIAEIMFLLGDYHSCTVFYDKEDYYEESDWLNRYFYALKQTGSTEKAYRRLAACREEILQDIKEAENTAEEWDSRKDLIEYIASQRERLAEIETGYRQIFTSNEKPPFNYQPTLLEKCYYIYCPRHYEQD